MEILANLGSYIQILTDKFKDIRVKRSIHKILSNITEHRSLNIYAQSADVRAYEAFRGLINGDQVCTLDSDIVLDCVRCRTEANLGSDACVYYVLHDGCDIRKPNSKEMENLGDVLSLSKQVIRGYKTLNSVIVNMQTQSLELSFHETYSNKMSSYIGESTLNNPLLKAALSTEQAALVENKTYINTKVILFKAMKMSSLLLKKLNPLNVAHHVLDREFDDEEIFKFIDVELKDKFTIRAINTRNSHETHETLTPKGKISTVRAHFKLTDKIFQNTSSYEIEEMKVKGKNHKKVIATIEYEPLKLGEKTYYVVRIMLAKEGVNLFKQPMLLITNCVITTAEQAKNIYKGYLLRFKIEVVFRFLKQYLGWEAFQVRDFNSIKNLLAIAFFLAGFFPELTEQIKQNPLAIRLCQLANSKGKITMHFMLKGIEILTHYEQVRQWKEQNLITEEQINQLLQNIRTQNIKT
jgi:hypothetical protein